MKNMIPITIQQNLASAPICHRNEALIDNIQ